MTSNAALPDDHVHSFQGPLLIVTHRASDIGLVGWHEKLWTRQKKRKASRNAQGSARSLDASHTGDDLRLKRSEACSRRPVPDDEAPHRKWRASFDTAAECWYYYNESLNTTQWEFPQGAAVEADAAGDYHVRNGVTSLPPHVAPSGSNGRDEQGYERTLRSTVSGATDGSAELAQRPAAIRFAPAKKDDLEPDVERYWVARYSLLSRWAHGVCVDEKGLFSVTPEVIARHHADMLAGGSRAFDAFCGCGGNAVQLARTFDKVIACDCDKVQLDMAQRNAQVYGVADRIDFVLADAFTLATQLTGVDAVFLSPPWGGPTDAAHSAVFDPSAQIPGFGRLSSAASGSHSRLEVPRPSVAAYLPRNLSLTSLEAGVAADVGLEVLCVERNILNGVFKAITLYARA